jgi:hypothetical protein
MFGSVVLDVAIGMAFVYLLLSLIASVVQEMLSTFMQLRPANLLRGVRSLFSGDSLWGEDLVDSLYGHGLIRGLFADPEEDLKERQPAAANDANFAQPVAPADSTQSWKPSYPHRLDSVRYWLRGWLGIKPEKNVRSVSNQLLLPAYIPSRTFALALMDILNRNKATGSELMQSITQSLAEHHWIYKENKVGEALYALAVHANGDIKTFQKSIENWYGDSMDRASSWYKRYTQTILLFIGFGLAVMFNVSTVRVAQTLWFDRDTRMAMANAADQYAKAHPNPPGAEQKNNPSSTPGDLAKKLQESAEAFDTATSSALLPVGWKHSASEYWNSICASLDKFSWSKAWWEPFDIRFLHAMSVLAGWLMTAIAISLGAPFWFDILNKIMVVRGTIKPQEKSQEEGSKDKAPAAS